MEQKFGINSIDIKALREFYEREGKMVEYRKGEQLEREGGIGIPSGRCCLLVGREQRQFCRGLVNR